MMTPSQRATQIEDVVKDLDVRFSFEPLLMSKSSNSPQEFDAKVEANVWCTDGVILRDRVTHSAAHLRACKKYPVLFWEKKHCIDSLMHMQASLRVYKTFETSHAQDACQRLNDRLAMLIAPTQRVWIQSHNLAAELMKSAWEFIVAYHVMNS